MKLHKVIAILLIASLFGCLVLLSRVEEKETNLVVLYETEPTIVAETNKVEPEPTIKPEPTITQRPQPVSRSYTRSEAPIYVGEPVENGVLLGTDFTLTHYCHCIICCGKDNGITASGRRVEAGITVAVDRSKIPLGTYLRIELSDGTVYRARARADDVGGVVKGNKIDIYIPCHNEALRRGVIRNASVYIID